MSTQNSLGRPVYIILRFSTPPPPAPAHMTATQFFTSLADRHATLRRQEELEGVLLRQATAAVWAARQGRLGKRSTGGSAGPSTSSFRSVHSVTSVARDSAGDRTSPLGPRLAWLACEELTSFFQQRDDLQGGQSRRSTAATQDWALGALSQQHPARRQLFGEGVRYAGGNEEEEGVREEEEESGSCWRRRRLLDKEELLKLAVARTGLNLILPASTHRGVTFKPRSPCVFCGLPLLSAAENPAPPAGGFAEGSVGGSGGSGGGGVAGGVAGGFAGGFAERGGGGATWPPPGGGGLGLVVRACGHGYHARCMEQSVGGLLGWGEGENDGRGEARWESLRCPECR